MMLVFSFISDFSDAKNIKLWKNIGFCDVLASCCSATLHLDLRCTNNISFAALRGTQIINNISFAARRSRRFEVHKHFFVALRVVGRDFASDLTDRSSGLIGIVIYGV